MTADKKPLPWPALYHHANPLWKRNWFEVCHGYPEDPELYLRLVHGRFIPEAEARELFEMRERVKADEEATKYFRDRAKQLERLAVCEECEGIGIFQPLKHMEAKCPDCNGTGRKA